MHCRCNIYNFLDSLCVYGNMLMVEIYDYKLDTWNFIQQIKYIQGWRSRDQGRHIYCVCVCVWGGRKSWIFSMAADCNMFNKSRGSRVIRVQLKPNNFFCHVRMLKALHPHFPSSPEASPSLSPVHFQSLPLPNFPAF